MGLKFIEEGHVYESTDDEKIKWTSVTSLVAKFKPKFDRDGQAKKSSKNKYPLGKETKYDRRVEIKITSISRKN